MSEPEVRPLRILEIETYGRGGLNHYTFNLSSALAGRGHEVTLMTSHAFELADRHAPSGLRVLTTIAPFTNRFRMPKLMRGPAMKIEAAVDALAVAARTRRLRPDVIHLHSTNTSALAFLTSLRRLNIPIVVTAHDVMPHERGRFQDEAFRRAYRLCDLIIAHSEHDRRRLVEECEIPEHRITVIPHGEYGFFEDRDRSPDRRAARRSLGLSEDDEAVLFFGYIRHYKGLDVLLDAWPEIVAERPAARLVIAGDAGRLPRADRLNLERRAAEAGAICHFHYVAFDDVGRYFAAAELTALPYRHISQSGILYLALALGVPVVATEVGGLAEVLEDRETALLVPPESPTELAHAIAELLSDPGLRTRLTQGGRRLAHEHSWPSIAERTESALAALAAKIAGKVP